MPRLTLDMRTRIIRLYYVFQKARNKYVLIQRRAKEEQIVVSTRQVQRLVKRWKLERSIADKPRPNSQKKLISDEGLIEINRLLLSNNELTARIIKRELLLIASESTVLRAIHSLGWRNKRTEYCQIVSNRNQHERLHFCCASLTLQDHFDDVVFIDEATVEIRIRAYKHWHKSFPIEVSRGKVGKFKHGVKVHVWAGISRSGSTPIVIFTGKMNSKGFQKIMKIGFLPFIYRYYPFGHRLYMDNDPKHVSYSTRRFFDRHQINRLQSPAQSPDLNPIEMVWNDLKYFLCTYYKPTSKSDLIEGICRFWKYTNVDYCNKKIDHIFNVMRKVIALNGRASGL